MTDRIKALEDALTLAANRLHRVALDFDTGSRRFIEALEWADEARAALAASQTAQPVTVTVKPLVWIATGDAGDFMAYDPLFERQVLSLDPAAYDTERVGRIMAALDVQPLTVQDAGKNGIYVASKAKYGSEWKAMRDSGWPIVSTWINESGPGETYDWPDLWSRCVSEAANSAALVVISREDDVLKGAWVELGAALAAGIPVFAVGISRYSIRHHPLITHYERETDAFDAALRAIAEGRA